jgi:probable HAF family extracellular repeat protein
MKAYLVLAVCASGSVSMGQSITDLGLLPGTPGSHAMGVSADGSVVVGYGGPAVIDGSGHAFRWTQSGGMQALGALPGDSNSTAMGVSGDGLTVVGFSGPAHNFQWTSAGGMSALSTPGWLQTKAVSASGDGSVIVGDGLLVAAGGNRVFRWTAAGGVVDMGVPPQVTTIFVTAVSADGSTAVGFCTLGNTDRAWLWTASGGMVLLPAAGTQTPYAAAAASGDGSVVVGYTATRAPFKWTAAHGTEVLGVLAGDTVCHAEGLSADGRVTVGNGQTATSSRALMWSDAVGVVDLNAYLPTLGISLTGWTLETASSISGDGQTIVGDGHHNGSAAAWVVHLGSGCGSADFNCDGDVGTDADIEAFFACISGLCPPPPCSSDADFDGDGDVGTDADIEAFFRVLAGGVC